MKRVFAKLTIGLYLGVLFAGIAAHTMNFGTNSHPAMYYIVWDMFCGWTAHEIRYHMVAEGESGTYYDLTEGPWGSFKPYGDLSRTQYDILGNALPRIALNTLKHTEHEPIVRILVAEEVWSKKFNLSDHAWSLRFDEPKDPKSYFWVRTTMDGNGVVMDRRPDYLAHLYTAAVINNPRLQSDSRRGKPFIAINPNHRSVVLGMNDASLLGQEEF